MFLGSHLNSATTGCLPHLGRVTTLLITYLAQNQNSFPFSLAFSSHIYLHSHIDFSCFVNHLSLGVFFFFFWAYFHLVGCLNKARKMLACLVYFSQSLNLHGLLLN